MILIWDSRYETTARVPGIRGRLVIGPMVWPVIARGGNYKRLRPNVADNAFGKFDCEFGWWTSSSGAKAKAIRVLGNYSRGRIYIHPANWPQQLTGCVAPGVIETGSGVASSRRAMLQIFGALGGWEDRRRAPPLVVLDQL